MEYLVATVFIGFDTSFYYKCAIAWQRRLSFFSFLYNAETVYQDRQDHVRKRFPQPPLRFYRTNTIENNLIMTFRIYEMLSAKKNSIFLIIN